MTWPAEAVWEQVSPLLPGVTVEVLPQLDSTNAELMRRARAGAFDPVLLVAEQQTAGRGRLGRQWVSAPGASLTFSLALPLTPPDWAGLSLAVGVALADALHPRVALKWPNDLWLDGRKLGGILIETVAVPQPPGRRQAVVGVGINLLAPHAQGLSVPPAALGELLPGLDAGAVFARLALPLVQAMRAFERVGFAPFQAGYRARDLLQGRPVSMSDGTDGTAQGVDATGGLLVHTAAGMKTITSAEVSVRPG